MVPYKDGKANRGHSCVKGRFAWGYTTHKERILKPMIREDIAVPGAVTWDEAFNFAAAKFKGIQQKYGRDAVGGITSSRCTNEETYPGAKTDPRRLRQQQRRYLRPRLPFADRLPVDHLRHLGRHARFRPGRTYRRRHGDRRQSGFRPSGVRLAAEEAAAPGRQADRARSAPHRNGGRAAHDGAASAADARHQCRRAHGAGARHRRGPRRRSLRARTLRLERVRGMGRLRGAAEEQPGDRPRS